MQNSADRDPAPTPTGPVRVAILDDYQGVATSFAPWSEAPLDLELSVHRAPLADDDALVAALDGCQVAVLMRERTPLRRTVVERLPDLRLVVTTGRANSAIEADLGVMVCGTDSSSAGPAELTWALVTALRRHLIAEDRAVRAGEWQSTVGETLEGSTLGVIGLGRIGTRVATVGQAFGMRVLAWSANLDHGRAREMGVEPVAKEELLAASDVVSLHLRLSERSRHTLGEPEFALMRTGAVLVNTARSGLVDTAALCRALESGRLGGAGLDVFDREPLGPKDPLLDAPRTVLTPHLGYVTRQNYRVFYEQALEDIVAFFAGSPLRVVQDARRP
ncbi:D-2-hydroxyacid dehydrogenase family protein [Nocardiopsis aegyptia]|uniref:D-2-hydroxyacid dehydrogenase family protein n=1 Tax=Nocardiopsis aegyptia TaxID=220378 RepID=UPI00367213B0